MITLSIVSHGQGEMIRQLLSDLDCFVKASQQLQIIITCNIPEQVTFNSNVHSLEVVANKQPKGFGANHNHAFELAKGNWFCVLNPDIRITQDPFAELVSALQKNAASLVSPKIVNSFGEREDNVRYFPTLLNTISRIVGFQNAVFPQPSTDKAYCADWVGGMFMFFDSVCFKSVGGFDEGFFLYYEDADICTRLWQQKRKVLVAPSVIAIHDAQRTSHRNFKYLLWHLKSMLRYFYKHLFRYPTR